jgi:NADH-quinone oxidoreductase subunit N
MNPLPSAPPSALHSDSLHFGLVTLSPLILLAAVAVVVMLAAAFYRHPRPVMMLTLAGLVLSFASLFLPQGASPQVTALLVLDHYALFFIGLIVVATFVVAVLCYRYFGGDESRHEALYILLLLAALGGGVLVASSHFASFLLGLELLSISLFALIAYPRFAERPLEAGIKYLILAGFSSGLLFFGMALVYAQLGTMQFAKIGTMIAAPDQALELYGLAGLALIVTGVGFKLALVPFHMWTPDVYEGAPAPITAFIATVSKGAMLALLLRYFLMAEAYQSQSITFALSLVAVTTILVGNLLALLQDNIKRILAYSSIAQLGYLLVGFLAFDPLAIEAVA